MKIKLKANRIILISGFILLIIGFIGSAMMLFTGLEQAKIYIKNNTKMVQREIYTQKQPLTAIDLRDFPIDDLTIELSTDGRNRVEVTYNQIAYNAVAEFDTRYPEKLNIRFNPLQNETSNANSFDVIKERLSNIVYGRRSIGQSAFFGIPLPQIKVALKLTAPTAVLVRNKYEIRRQKIDEKLISPVIDLNYNNYIEEASWQTLSEVKKIINFDDAELYVQSSAFYLNDSHIEVKEKEKLYISGSPQLRTRKHGGNFSVDLTKVKTAYIDLAGFYNDFHIINANEVILDAHDAVPTLIEYTVNGTKKKMLLTPDTVANMNIGNNGQQAITAKDPLRTESQHIVIEAKSIKVISSNQEFDLPLSALDKDTDKDNKEREPDLQTDNVGSDSNPEQQP